MPAALPIKQQCFGDPVSKVQGVKLGNPRTMPEAAAKGREAQRAAADQFAAWLIAARNTDAAGWGRWASVRHLPFARVRHS